MLESLLVAVQLRHNNIVALTPTEERHLDVRSIGEQDLDAMEQESDDDVCLTDI